MPTTIAHQREAIHRGNSSARSSSAVEESHMSAAVTEDYLRRSGLDISWIMEWTAFDAMSWFASMPAGLMPAYAKKLLPWSVSASAEGDRQNRLPWVTASEHLAVFQAILSRLEDASASD